MAIWKPFSKKKLPSAAGAEDSLVEEAAPIGASTAEETPVPSVAAAPSRSEPTDVPAEPSAKRGLLGRFKQALKKTVAVLNTDIRDLVGKEGRLVDDEFLAELFADLVKTDMGTGPAGEIRDVVHDRHRNRVVTADVLVASAKECIRRIMQADRVGVRMAETGPTVVMVVGVNGSGKTTSIAKLAHLFKSQGRSVVLGAGDTFRAAAVEQLTIWAQRIGAEIITGRSGTDPASVAYQAVDYAVQHNIDVCIVDTAGRLQTQSNLMDQLSKIRRVIAKVIPDAPHEVLLVLDATAGQNAISQAKGFSQAAGCTGIFLAKLDGTAKGGVAIPIWREFGLPVKFIGLGETPDALAEFDVDRYVEALLDLE
jgi:fused signal recognition particle receptor